MAHPLEPRLATYIAGRLPEASGVTVSNLERISGGASRETYRFLLSRIEGGQTRTRKLILRRDPPASLIDTEGDKRAAAERAMDKIRAKFGGEAVGKGRSFKKPRA